MSDCGCMIIRWLPLQAPAPSASSYVLSPWPWLPRSLYCDYCIGRATGRDRIWFPKCQIPNQTWTLGTSSCTGTLGQPYASLSWRWAVSSTWRLLGAAFLSWWRSTEDGFGGLRVGDGWEPLGSILLNVVVKDAAVHHQTSWITIISQSNRHFIFDYFWPVTHRYRVTYNLGGQGGCVCVLFDGWFMVNKDKTNYYHE